MLGMIPGNGHPYSCSAIINGYDPDKMAECPYPGIPRYLGAQPLETVRVPGAQVTHIWTDDPTEAPQVAAAAKIPNVVARPEEVIGHVDAVIVATDDGNDHVRRVRPFIEAGLPAFIDKPLAINLSDLRQFVQWHDEGRKFLSTSGMRYAPEIGRFQEAIGSLGELRWITSVTSKAWERYGIHALEAVYPLLGPGFISARTDYRAGKSLVYLEHESGVLLTVAALTDALGSFGAVHFYGTASHMPVTLQDTYHAFRAQLMAFLAMVREGNSPVPFAQTLELMAILIAGVRSREQDGRSVQVREVLSELDPKLVPKRLT
jgi:predicted dehydrogenase